MTVQITVAGPAAEVLDAVYRVGTVLDLTDLATQPELPGQDGAVRVSAAASTAGTCQQNVDGSVLSLMTSGRPS